MNPLIFIALAGLGTALVIGAWKWKKKHMTPRMINMIMLGPSRVGKTSLLATMYKQFAQLGVSFDFLAVGDTSDQLNDAHQKLEAVTKTSRFTVVEGLLQGTQGFNEHGFKVCFHQRKEFDLIFHDYRGGVLMKAGSDKELEAKQAHDTLRSLVSNSHVIFNVLDAAVLMEAGPTESDTLNSHTRIYELLHDTLQAGEKYLIVFVLVKCETYVKTASSRERLVNRFEERHAAVLRLIEKLNQNHKNVVGLLIPARTMGCVEFKEIDDRGNYVFERKGEHFKPEEVDQPLRYALSFALNHVNENRWFGERVLRRLAGRGPKFDQALKEFCNGRKSTYKMYGNKDLLR